MSRSRAACLALAAILLAGAAAPAWGVSLSVGLDFTAGTLASSGSVPPDTMGAVGEDHIVQLINGEFRVYSKADGALLVQQGTTQFWTDAGVAPVVRAFDPRVVYDPSSQRWFAVEVDNPRQANRFLVAVSQSADPTGGWNALALDSDPTDTTWADFPMLGLNADGVFISANMFTIGSNTSVESKVVVLPKADLLAATPTLANATQFTHPTTQLSFTPQVTVDLDGSGMPAPILASNSVFASVMQVARIEGPVTAPTLSGLGSFFFLSPGSLAAPPEAEQPGPSHNLDAGDARFSANAVLRNGSLWGVRSLNVDGRAAVQWFQIDPSTSIILQEGVIADAELDLYYPSVSVNEFDEVVIGMSGSSESQFVSAYAILGETLAGLTSFGDLLLLKAGLGPYERVFSGRNRWGDYSATVVDPSDPNVFWTFQEWADVGNNWATQITQLILVPEPGAGWLLMLGALVFARRTRRARGRPPGMRTPTAQGSKMRGC